VRPEGLGKLIKIILLFGYNFNSNNSILRVNFIYFACYQLKSQNFGTSETITKHRKIYNKVNNDR
jgi:hypothetical protein